MSEALLFEEFGVFDGVIKVVSITVPNLQSESVERQLTSIADLRRLLVNQW